MSRQLFRADVTGPIERPQVDTAKPVSRVASYCTECVVIALVLLLVSMAQSQSRIEDCTVLDWDYDPMPNLGVFRLYVSRESGVYTMGKPTAILPAIPSLVTEYSCRSIRAFLRTPGTYYAVVTAIDPRMTPESESELSNEITFTYDGNQVAGRPTFAPMSTT